ncbi:MAG: flavodoxin family protein [Pleomorphochaeta sp.]
MNIMLINGSPHHNGCTNAALDVISETLKSEGIDSTIFWIENKPLSGCLGCGKCANTGNCIFNDKVNEFLDLAQKADGFIFGSPVHYASVSGSMTSFMDRAFFADLKGKRNSFYLKPGAAVVSARRAGTTAALDQMNKYFLHAQMILIPSRYWNMVHGTTVDQIYQDLEGLQILRTLARNMSWFLKCKEAGKKNKVEFPIQEERISTNFIR